MHYFSNLFWNETLRVSDSSSVHHKELFTVHSAMVYVIQVCRQNSRIRIESWKLSVWHIPLLSVQRITPDDGQRNCPKHVEFRSKINLRNSASSLLYYKEICHDARSRERKIPGDV
jgi:hypothetical protein